ncbi:MAG: hypothetical protein AAF518_14070 [Spirochaetota bacterium]
MSNEQKSIKVTFFKDVFLFSLLTLVTLFVIFGFYPSLPLSSRVWSLAAIVMIVAVVFSVHHWQDVSKIFIWGWDIYKLPLAFVTLFLVVANEKIFIATTKADFIVTLAALFSFIPLLTNLLWIVRYLPRHKNMYLEISLVAFISISLGVLLALTTKWMQILDTTTSPVPLAGFPLIIVIAAMIGFISNQFMADVLGGFAIGLGMRKALAVDVMNRIITVGFLGAILGSVFATNTGTEIGAFAGSILGGLLTGSATSLRHKFAQIAISVIFAWMISGILETSAGYIGWSTTLLATLVLLTIVQIIKNKDGFPREKSIQRVYYFFGLFALAALPIYTIYHHWDSRDVFFLLVIPSMLLLITAEFFLISILRTRILDRPSLQPLPRFTKYQFLFVLLIVTFNSTIFYAFFYKIAKATQGRTLLAFSMSFIFTFPLLIIYNEFFAYISHASRVEKQDRTLDKEVATMLCQIHYHRIIKKRNALIYYSYECPAVDCKREHVLFGVNRVIGFIRDGKFTEEQKDGTLYISLWDQELRQARYAMIDQLEVCFSKEFTEDDYNLAIQSVVGKLYNSMPADKLKKIQFTVDAQVQLSEASKRLLQDFQAAAG